MYIEWINVLSKSLIFKNIDENGLNAMLHCLKPAKKLYNHREIIAVNGSHFSGIGMIASGKVALTRETFAGNRIILDILEPGDIFGEMVAFSNQSHWLVTVIAQEESCVFFLPADKVLGNCSNICSAHSSLIMNMLNILSNKALHLSKTIEHLSARTVRGKISSYLLDQLQPEHYSFRVPMKCHEMADYLGVPRPSLSRELGNMKREQIIDYSGSEFTIRDALRLEQSLD